jgi:hypothetical protein
LVGFPALGAAIGAGQTRARALDMPPLFNGAASWQRASASQMILLAGGPGDVAVCDVPGALMSSWMISGGVGAG